MQHYIKKNGIKLRVDENVAVYLSTKEIKYIRKSASKKHEIKIKDIKTGFVEKLSMINLIYRVNDFYRENEVVSFIGEDNTDYRLSNLIQCREHSPKKLIGVMNNGRNCFVVYKKINNKRVHVGKFHTAEEGGVVYDIFMEKLFGKNKFMSNKALGRISNYDEIYNRLYDQINIAQVDELVKLMPRSSSNYIGVSFNPIAKVYSARISILGKSFYIGSSKCKHIAALMYNNFIKEIFPEKPLYNKVPNNYSYGADDKFNRKISLAKKLLENTEKIGVG